MVVLGTGTTLLVHRGSKMTSSSATEALLWPQRADPLEDSERGFYRFVGGFEPDGELGRQVGVSTLGLFVRGLAHRVKD